MWVNRLVILKMVNPLCFKTTYRRETSLKGWTKIQPFGKRLDQN
jgi:hypothetical protein